MNEWKNKQENNRIFHNKENTIKMLHKEIVKNRGRNSDCNWSTCMFHVACFMLWCHIFIVS